MPQYLFDLDKVIDNAGKLYTLPDICLRLRELIDEGGSAAEIARLIQTDTALSARLLQLANSALYAFPARVASISQAITLVGTESLYQLALATSAAAVFKGAGGRFIEMKQFWRHSIYCALLTGAISKQQVGKGKEMLFVTGLLHNIGQLLLLEQLPDVAATALVTVNDRQYPWHRELEVTGYSCAELGAALLNIWNLPKSITEPIKFQHQPAMAGHYLMQAAILHIALCIAGYFTREKTETDYLGAIQRGVAQRLNFDVEAVTQRKTEIEAQANEVMRIFV